MEITIRQWSRADIDLIGSLLRDIYCETAPRFGAELFPDADRRLIAWLQDRARFRSSIAYIAEYDDRMVGFLLGRINNFESEPPILKPRGLALIEIVYVVEKFRRQGVATALVNRVFERAASSGLSGVETTFETDEAAASALWNSLGFSPILTRAYCEIIR